MRGVVFIVLLNLTVFQLTAKPIDFKGELTWIKLQMENGHLPQSEAALIQLCQTKKLTTYELFALNKQLSKVYLMQQNFTKYGAQVDQMMLLSKRIHPIYQAEAYAHKAYYWHYLMWPDSALVYADKSMKLYRKHELFRSKIDIPFIYEVHAITFLYRRDGTKPKAYLNLPIEEFKKNQFQWFDSALFYQSKFPFEFTTERSMLYRSYANRWLDIVVGDPKSKPKPIQLYAFQKANDLYDKGIACLKPCHKNDLLTLTGLKGCIHTYIQRYKDAETIFHKVLQQIGWRDLFDRSKVDYQPLMVLLTFKVRNALFLPFNSINSQAQIHLIQQLKPEFWKSFDDRNALPYDPYRTSPYINLFYLYLQKSIQEKNNQGDLQRAVSYLLTLKTHFYFLKHHEKKHRYFLPYFDVQRIQKRLKKDECYLFMQSDSDYLSDRKILISKHRVQLVHSSSRGKLENEDLSKLSFQLFQRYAHQDFKNSLENVLQQFPSVKKLFISYDDKIPYEILMKDTLGHSYSDANYAGNEINFVRLYNPYTYFAPEKIVENKHFDVRYLNQTDQSKLLFMDDLFRHYQTNQQFTNQQYQGNLEELLAKQGTLHLYGHGEFLFSKEALTYGFQMSYHLQNKLHSERQIDPDFICNRDLVVLNNCFSGYPFFNVNEFNKTIPLRIMNNGAKALICSPNKIDDYFSATFFRLFYAHLEKDMLFEDAFFLARNQFFEEHPEMRHPQIWNGLQLMVSFPLKQKQSSSANSVIYQFIGGALIVLSLVLLRAALRKRKLIHR